MKIHEIILEDTSSADIGATGYSNIANVAFPLFGKKKMIRRAVDPNGYIGYAKAYTGGYKHKVKTNASK